MQKHSRLFKSYMKELDTGVISEQRIIRIRSMLRWADRLGSMHNGCTLLPGELDTIVNRIYREMPRVSEKQAVKGLVWLKAQWKTPKGALRKNNPFNVQQCEILENLDHFKLVGFEEIPDGPYISSYFPIYRTIGKNGNSFDYYSGAWQTGLAGVQFA